MSGANDGSWHARVPAFEEASRPYAERRGGKPLCLWLTGLSGSGKSTISERLLVRLRGRGLPAYGLDGDVLRAGLNRDLSFSDADRHENIRRTAEVARLMIDAGLIVVVSLISPFRADRDAARGRFGRNEFFEVFVDAPLAVCEQRDPKGLYARARRGEIPNMTGIDSPYEVPPQPDLHLKTQEVAADECVDRVLDWLVSRGLIAARNTEAGGNADVVPMRAVRGQAG